MAIWKLAWLKSSRDEGELPCCNHCEQDVPEGAPYLAVMSGAPSPLNKLEMGEGVSLADICEPCCERMGVFRTEDQWQMLDAGNRG